MPNFIITYDVSNDDERVRLRKAIEALGLPELLNNRTTFFGRYPSYEALLPKMRGIVKDIKFGKDDYVTLYYPRLHGMQPDIADSKLIVNGV